MWREKSVPCNLKTPEGIKLLLRLVKRADVFVSNYREKALEKLGIGYERLRELKPNLIYATISGYGTKGPDKDSPGFDTTSFWAKSGMLLDIAQEGSIVNPPYAVGDFATGQSLAYGISSALFNRERTGKGCKITTSLLAEAVFLNFDAVIESQYGELYPKNRTAPMRALLNTYQCGDGKWVAINAIHHWNISWLAICKFIGREDLIDQYHCVEDTMYENAPAVVAALDAGFKKFTRDEVYQGLRSCGKIAVEKVQHSIDVCSDPQVIANKIIVDWTDADGNLVRMPTTPLRIGDDEPAEFHAGPQLGSFTTELMRRLGYTNEQIQQYIDRKIVIAEK